MVVVESPEWLPPGFTVKIKYKEGRKIKYYFNVATGKKYNSKKEVIGCATEDNSLLVTPQTKNGDDNGPSLINKVDLISDKTNDSAAWLPNGWTVEERKRKSGPAEGSAYKVFTDLSSGSKFYSKAAVIRYLSTIDHADTMTKQNKNDNLDEPLPDMSLQVVPMTSTGKIRGRKRKANSLVKIDNVDEPVPEKSGQIISMTDTGGVHEQKRKGNSLAMIDNVGEPFPDMSPQVISTTNTNGIRGKKRKSSSFVTVSIETTTPDDLPSGWIKEIRTSKSGSKMRKDPFYTDPVSGYIFRSKPDALRYLKTNDIRSCACKPLKRDSDDIELIENKTPSSNPANEKLSIHKRELFSGEEPNGGVESSGTKNPAEPETKILKQKQACVEERVSCESSNKDAEMGDSPKPESDLSKNGVRVKALYVAIGSPVTDPSTKQPFPESGGRNKMGSRKSKKRMGSSLPLRTSKRLAGSEPEMQSNLDLNERSIRAAVRGFTGSGVDTSPSLPLEASDSIPQTSNIEPANEAVDNAVMGVETRQDVDQLREVERPPTEGAAIPEEPSGEKASEKPLDDGQRSQESQLCYDFGDSWSDPLEFALKTLRGEIPIDDTLTFPSCFGERLDTTCLKQSQFDPPINFQSEFDSKSESSKKHNCVDPLPASSPSLSALGNIGFSSFSGFNYQPKSESSKKHNAVDSLPASSPSLSALGNISFSSLSGFNYQPKSESSKKHNAVDPLPASSPSLSALGNIGFNYQPSKEVGKKDSQTKFNP